MDVECEILVVVHRTLLSVVVGVVENSKLLLKGRPFI